MRRSNGLRIATFAALASLAFSAAGAQQPAPAPNGAAGPAASGGAARTPATTASQAAAKPTSHPVVLGPSKEDVANALRAHTEGGQLLEKKEYRKAVLKLGEALKLNPNLPDAWFDLALAYTYAGEYKFAEYCIAKLKKMGKNTNFLQSELLKAKPPEKKVPEAKHSNGLEPGNVFEIPVPTAPPNQAAQALAAQYQAAGSKLYDAKDYAGAIEQYKQALAINPGLKDCWMDYSLSLTYSGKYDLAKAAIEELKKLGGEASFVQGELDKVKAAHPEAAAAGAQAIPAPPK